MSMAGVGLLHQASLFIELYRTGVQLNGAAFVHGFGIELIERAVDAQEVFLVLVQAFGEVVNHMSSFMRFSICASYCTLSLLYVFF